MSGAESVLMGRLGVFDLVDCILRKNVEACHRSVIQSMSQSFASKEVVLQSTAEEFYDIFHTSSCVMIPKGNPNHNDDVHSLAFFMKLEVIDVVRQSESKQAFLEEVTKSYSSVGFANGVITSFMRSAIDYSLDTV